MDYDILHATLLTFWINFIISYSASGVHLEFSHLGWFPQVLHCGIFLPTHLVLHLHNNFCDTACPVVPQFQTPISMIMRLHSATSLYMHLFTLSQYCCMHVQWIICLWLHCTLPAKYASEKKLKFYQYLAKIWTYLRCRQFIDLWYSVPNFKTLLYKKTPRPSCSSWVFMNTYMCCIRKTPAAIPPWVRGGVIWKLTL